MPSITYWNRLEPRPRSTSIVEALGAQVRDPLWMLTRQWQLGELQGEDAGTPAWVRVERSVSNLTGWREPGGALQPLDGSAPLELAALSEPRALDLSLRVELGQVFEERLAAHGGVALAAAFRAAYPLPPAPGGDPAAARFVAICGGRALDGGALLIAARASAPSLPPQPVLADADATTVRAALAELSAWADDVLGPLGDGAPAAWRPEQLAYRLEAVADTPRGERATLSVAPSATGDIEWFSFDLQSTAPGGGTPTRLAPLSLMPAHVRFRGIPNAGFWDFERATSDFGAVSADLRDLAKLVFLEFLLVQGNDWYVLPLQQPTGTLCAIDRLRVRDVFGRDIDVVRAGDDHFRLFALSNAADATARAEFLLVPPTAAGALQKGDALEEVRFLRDEPACMAWAVEHQTQNALGMPRAAAERTQSPPTNDSGRGDALRYRIQTELPENWFPLLPVSLDPARGEVALELASLLRPATSGQPATPILPSGRILPPSTQLREEQVPREGVVVRRVPFRCRWTDGTSRTWVARVCSVGTGPSSSGLRFDVATPHPERR